MNPTPTQSIGTPAAEVDIDAALVQMLLADQHPDLADLPLGLFEAGWDNTLFRLGDSLLVRLPRRAAAATLITHEQTWLPYLAPQLSLSVPAPVRIGTPARGYPWYWSIVPWLLGMSADQHPPLATQATYFAAFLRSLHTPAPADAPINLVRGCSLADRVQAVAIRMHNLKQETNAITPAIEQIWHTALEAPLDVPRVWLHGDLHPRNILVQDGVISGIIDWGDITAGDCATDLAAIWMLFDDADARQQVMAAYGNLSAATMQRAKGWAVLFGVMLLDSGRIDNPRNAAIGESVLRRVGVQQ
jgi:aminoglycoside phosphotransferase (APT) family kinase protein